MARKGVGGSLGAAVMDLLGTAGPPEISVGKMLAYVLKTTGPLRYQTGASKESVMRQVGVSEGTLRRWLTGKQAPSRKSAASLRRVYERFWHVNNKNARLPRGLSTAKLRIKNTTDPEGIVVHEGRDRAVNPFDLDASHARDWRPVLRAQTPEEALSAFITYVWDRSIDLPVADDYLEFGDGAYTIESL